MRDSGLDGSSFHCVPLSIADRYFPCGVDYLFVWKVLAVLSSHKPYMTVNVRHVVVEGMNGMNLSQGYARVGGVPTREDSKHPII